jgi:hypothetical protein
MTFAKRVMLLTPLYLAVTFSAHAETVGAQQATQLLARSQALEEKCHFLSASQHEELSTYVAKAEVAMVAKSSAETTKAIMTSGRAQGKAAACNDNERADIINIMGAAQQAMSQAQVASVEQPAQPRQMLPAPAVKPVKLSMAKDLKLAPPKLPRSAAKGALGQYAALTERYYLARRCNSLSYGAINGLYRNVVSSHGQVVSSFGVPAVRAVMLQSESRANASSCG